MQVLQKGHQSRPESLETHAAAQAQGTVATPTRRRQGRGLMQVAVVGSGYVGTVTAVCLARLGHVVVGLDADERRAKELDAGELPFFEPGQHLWPADAGERRSRDCQALAEQPLTVAGDGSQTRSVCYVDD